MKKIILLLVVFPSLFGFLRSQATDWRNYLLEQTIYSIESEGNFIWATTDSFLVKLDRLTSNTVFFPFPKIIEGLHYGIKTDNNGVKWLLCVGIGLYQFDENEWVKSEVEGSQWFTGIEIDRNNNIWIGTIRGLSKFDGDKWTHYTSKNSGLPYYMVGDIALDNKDDVWLANSNDILTPSHTLVKYDGKNWTEYPRGFGDWFLHVTPDDLGNVWIVSHDWESEHNTLLKFDGDNWEDLFVLNSEISTGYLSHMAIENNEIFWFGSNKGLARFDGNEWIILTSSNSDLVSDNITVVMIDETGTKWIGTDRGLAAYNENGIENEGVTSNNIETISDVEFHVLPNPAYDYVTLELDAHNEESLIEIFNAQGELLKSYWISDDQHTISINDLSKGVYVIRANVNNKFFYNKLVKY